MESIEVYKPAGTVEEDFVNFVKLELNDIRNTFFKIGFRLREANNNKYYVKLGYESIEECAEALFGFKKTTTYDLMAIASKFASKEAPMTLAENYKKFNQSQLVLLSRKIWSRDSFINRVKPEDSIEKIRKALKYWNGYYTGKYRISNFYKLKTLDELIESGDNYVASKNSMIVQPFIDPPENSGHPENEENTNDSVYPENSSDVIEISEGDYEDKTEEKTESSDNLKIIRCCYNCEHFCRFKNRLVINHQINGKVEVDGVCSVRCNEYNISFNPVYVPNGACGSFKESRFPIVFTDKDVNQQYGLPDEKLNNVAFEEIQKKLGKYLADMIDFMEYKIAWGGDEKKPAMRVVSSAMVDFIILHFWRYVDDNRTEIKNMLQASISKKVKSFDYHITLCGRTQPVNAFSGNAANWIIDSLLKDYLEKQEELKNKRKR